MGIQGVRELVELFKQDLPVRTSVIEAEELADKRPKCWGLGCANCGSRCSCAGCWHDCFGCYEGTGS